MYARLKAISGPNAGKVFEVDAKVPQIIGSSRGADLKLSDPSVSPFHCRLQVRSEMLFATDLDSRTGTQVNNVAIRENPISFGDTLTVGDTILLVQDPDAELREKIGSSAKAPAKPVPAPPAAKVKPLAPPAEAASGPAKYPDRAEKFVGQAFGPFQVGAIIARGRNATVMRAHDTRSGKGVALKIMPAAFSTDEAKVEKFMQAVKLVHTLRHPNIVTTLGAGKAGPFCWIAQELVDGESLTQALRHVGVAGTFDWRRALRVAIYLTRGMAYLHEQKIAYRNIGPQNIMVESAQIIPRLSDFLRVRPFYDLFEAGSNDSEEMGDALLLYMAPEQTREMTEVDPRSDIFNLGSLCYTFLTGHAPFEGGSLAETITKIRREQPELIKKYQLAVPEAFQGVVLQMLAKRPEDRYQTIAEALRDLERVLKYQGMTL